VNSLLLAPELFAGEGGITRILRLYLKALCDLAPPGDGVRFLSLNDGPVAPGELARYAGPSLKGGETCRRRKIAFTRRALQLAPRSDRIICGHVAQLPVAWLATRWGRRPPYYLVAHGIEVWRAFSPLERRALQGAERILCVSDYTRRQVRAHCPLAPERLVVLPNALDPFLPPPAARPPDPAPVILTVSRLSLEDNYKGIGHLIAALPAVARALPEVRLRVVGRGDGLPSLQAQARRLGVADRVDFAGYRSDPELQAELDRCRLFALPSQKEGFGLVYLEAMAHGRPCLGARAGGAPEVITPETGLLVEYGEVAQVAAALIEGLRRDWPLGPLLARAEEFSYLRFRERLGSLLER